MAETIRVYEEKKGLPIWAWLLPLLILLALLAYFLTHHRAQSDASATPASVTVNAFPDLGTVHFETDQATLSPDGQATLQRAAAALKANPTAHLRLEGYTDATGSAPHNDTLADRRTTAVTDYLKALGIAGSRLTGQGFGPANPVDTNATATGKADNRRVELFSQK